MDRTLFTNDILAAQPKSYTNHVYGSYQKPIDDPKILSGSQSSGSFNLFQVGERVVRRKQPPSQIKEQNLLSYPVDYQKDNHNFVKNNSNIFSGKSGVTTPHALPTAALSSNSSQLLSEYRNKFNNNSNLLKNTIQHNQVYDANFTAPVTRKQFVVDKYLARNPDFTVVNNQETNKQQTNPQYSNQNINAQNSNNDGPLVSNIFSTNSQRNSVPQPQQSYNHVLTNIDDKMKKNFDNFFGSSIAPAAEFQKFKKHVEKEDFHARTASNVNINNNNNNIDQGYNNPAQTDRIVNQNIRGNGEINLAKSSMSTRAQVIEQNLNDMTYAQRINQLYSKTPSHGNRVQTFGFGSQQQQQPLHQYQQVSDRALAGGSTAGYYQTDRKHFLSPQSKSSTNLYNNFNYDRFRNQELNIIGMYLKDKRNFNRNPKQDFVHDKFVQDQFQGNVDKMSQSNAVQFNNLMNDREIQAIHTSNIFKDNQGPVISVGESIPQVFQTQFQVAGKMNSYSQLRKAPSFNGTKVQEPQKVKYYGSRALKNLDNVKIY